MRRDQLEHAIRTACQIIGRPEVIVVGSQSILGTFSEYQPALVDRETILTRLSAVDERHRPAAEVAASWLHSL
jgi:hypothetical protein